MFKKLSKNDVYELLLDEEVVSREALDLVLDINGYNLDTLNDVLYAVTGYKDADQYLDYER